MLDQEDENLEKSQGIEANDIWNALLDSPNGEIALEIPDEDTFSYIKGRLSTIKSKSFTRDSSLEDLYGKFSLAYTLDKNAKTSVEGNMIMSISITYKPRYKTTKLNVKILPIEEEDHQLDGEF